MDTVAEFVHGTRSAFKTISLELSQPLFLKATKRFLFSDQEYYVLVRLGDFLPCIEATLYRRFNRTLKDTMAATI